MKKVHSSTRPQLIEFVGNKVLVASNIQEYEEVVGDRTLSGFEYDCEEYTQDEYTQLQNEKIASLE